MAIVKRKDFLKSRSFAVGEFEATEEQFEQSIGQFARTLTDPVGRSLRAQLSTEIAGKYVDGAIASIDALLGGRARTGAREAANAFMLERLRKELSRSPAFDNDDVEQEVQSCSREVAQLVLARWFEQLNEALRTASPVKLNANFLPNTMAVEDILAGVDFDAYGVGKLVVVNGLRTYWDGLVKASVKAQQPMAFGPRLHIVPDPLLSDQPYLLFDDGAAALAHMKRPAPAARPIATPLETSQARYLRLVEVVRQLFGERMDQLNPQLALSVFNSSLHGKMDNRLIGWDGTQLADVLFGEKPSPERALADSVETGVDLVMAGLASGPEDALNLLRKDRYAIQRQLREFSHARSTSIDAVTEAFALAVCVGAEYQPMRAHLSNLGRLPAGLDVHKQFAAAYGLSDDSAANLMSATFAGSAFATPGVVSP